MSILSTIKNIFSRGDVSGRAKDKPVWQQVKEDFQRSVQRFNTLYLERRMAHGELLKAISEHRATVHQVESVIGLCGNGCPHTSCPLHAFAQQQVTPYSEACPLYMAHRARNRDVEKKQPSQAERVMVHA